MKILVAVRQVPGPDSRLTLNASADWIAEDELSYQVNEPDAYALEAALQLKEQHGGEVVAMSAGPQRVEKAIRETLAKGADRGIHIEVEDPLGYDTLDLARLLAAAAASESPDLVLTGLQSEDLGYGQTGVVMAELLGWAHATIAVAIEAAGAGIRVKRELEGGWYQHLKVPFPAVVSIQSGIGKLRYANLMGMKRARSKEVKHLAPEELGVTPTPRLTMVRLRAPFRERQARIIDGAPREAAEELAELLRTEARVL
jgi:electron transfer flavoprotein beta subunit